MNRRRGSFLIAGVLVLAGLSGCCCRSNDRVRYVGPPPCDRCTTNGPMPPRFGSNTGPVPAGPPPVGVAVPAPPGVAVPPPGAVAVPPPGAVVVPPPPAQAAPPAAAVPFAPSAAAPPGGLPTNPAIQQNNYVSPGTSPAPAPPGASPRVYLQQPEPAAPTPETRGYPPQQTREPPPARDDSAASPALPVDIPQFASVKTNIASGHEPFAGGITWLKSHGYRTVLHLRAPGEDDSAAKNQFEQSGLRFVSLELSPQTLSREIVDQFNRLVADTNNLPLFVYDKDSSLAGALWYLHFRLVDQATEEKAREDAERLGFKQDRSDAHTKMWLAVQNLLKELKP